MQRASLLSRGEDGIEASVTIQRAVRRGFQVLSGFQESAELLRGRYGR